MTDTPGVHDSARVTGEAEREAMQAHLDAAYAKFNVRPLWWAKDALAEAMRTYAAQVMASTLEEAAKFVSYRGAIGLAIAEALRSSLSPPPQAARLVRGGFSYEEAERLLEDAQERALYAPPQTEAAPSPPPEADGRLPERETFWLVERNVEPPQYVSLNSSNWHPDVWQAKRFKTERAAHDHWRMMGEGRQEFKVIEHMFIYKPAHDSAPSPPPEADGWIPWQGGECPVDPKSRVDVRFRNGGEEHAEHGIVLAEDWLWENIPSEHGIIAYRPASSRAAPLDEADWRKGPVTAGMLYEMIFDGTFVSEGGPPVLTPSMFSAAVIRIATAALERGRTR